MATTQLPAISLVSSDALPWPRHRVEIKPAWSDGWEHLPYLDCAHASIVASPSVSRAVFKYRTGHITWPDADEMERFSPISCANLFVRVVMLGDTSGGTGAIPTQDKVLWVGRFHGDDEEIHGDDHGPLGDQEMQAAGLEAELDRLEIESSWCSDDPLNVNPVEISRPLVFNERFKWGFNQTGNRSTQQSPFTVTGTPAYVFNNQGNAWTVRQIIDYLLNFHVRSDIRFQLGGSSAIIASLDNLILPKVEVGGRTVRAVLNDLINQKRGLGWCVRVPDSGDPVIEVFSQTPSPATAGDYTVPGSANLRQINLANWTHEPGDVRVSEDSRSRFGEIHLLGAPTVACFTVSVADETLVQGWTSALETEYKAGASPNTDRGNNDRHRGVEKFRAVYQHFLLPRDWSQTAGGGQGSAKTDVVLRVGGDGRLRSAAGTSRKWGQTLASSLPIRRQAGPVDTEAEFCEPKIFVLNADKNVYVYVDRGSEGEDEPGTVRMLDTECGFEVNMTPNHKMARDRFSGAAGTNSDPQEVGYDWTKMVATLAMRTDERLRVALEIPGGDPERILQINVEDAELWYVLPNTVIDVKADGTLDRTPPTPTTSADYSLNNYVIMRDDSKRLRSIAVQAAAWYGVKRNPLSMTVRELMADYPVGTMILSVSDAERYRTVNCVVSSVTWDLEHMTTTLQTSYCELDFTNGLSDLPKLKN